MGLMAPRNGAAGWPPAGADGGILPGRLVPHQAVMWESSMGADRRNSEVRQFSSRHALSTLPCLLQVPGLEEPASLLVIGAGAGDQLPEVRTVV